MYNRYIKRIIDIFLSSAAILLSLIPMLIVSVIILIDDPGPVIFTQKRIGLHKKTFMLFKFRSMKKSAPRDIPTHLLKNPEKYLIRSGKYLRKFSLDELPQLFNIFIGDMSFVGPRPALWNQYDLIEERDRSGANDVKPGLTGWAQINGRDELSLEEKTRYDAEYVEKQSFLFDCKCFFGTIPGVLSGRDVYDGSGEEDRK